VAFRAVVPHNSCILGPTATSLIQHFGYAGLGLGLVIGCVGLFSSEVVLLLAGVALRQHTMQLLPILLVAVIAQLVGGLVSHAIGQYGGVPLIERYGRYVLLSKRDLARAHRWFARYGRGATILGYCLPFIRGYVGYAAGVAGEPRRVFALSALVGSAIWTAVLVTLGYLLASHVGGIEQAIRPVSDALVAIVILAVGYIFWHRLRDARGSAA
jgi:membrane protein DedA with SNARE-associated domain